ncbi:hypothetical protein FRC01_001413 [Tulasnella sp. 417]|nr:hypothetical protein FRC01_001413 [Tulasnella sp. 417]
MDTLARAFVRFRHIVQAPHFSLKESEYHVTIKLSAAAYTFRAVLGRQWLVYYRKRSGGGPERQRWEQLKRFLGAERWQLEPILDDVLPSLLQIGLIIFCASLLLYLRHLSFAISVIVGIPMYIGLAFFVWSAVCTVKDKFCPFQSPLSHVLIWSARTVPPAIRAIKKLKWKQSSLKVSLKPWLYALVQRQQEESPKTLQVIALQRAIRTSDDPETLLHATANIFAITDVSQIEQLWSELSFQERFLDQLQHAYSRMLQLRGQNQVNIATASQRLYSAAAAHMIISFGISQDVPGSFKSLIDALQRPSVLIPGTRTSNSPSALIRHSRPFTILHLFYYSGFLLDRPDNDLDRFYEWLQASFIDVQSDRMHWRVLPITCSIISHLYESRVESRGNMASLESLIDPFICTKEDATEILRATLDVLVLPGGIEPLDSNALLIGTLHCVNQCVSADGGYHEFFIDHKLSLLEICEQILPSPQLSEAARQVIRKIRYDLSERWLQVLSRSLNWNLYEALQQYISKARVIHQADSDHDERVDILQTFSPPIRQSLAFPPDTSVLGKHRRRFVLIKAFNEFVEEVDQTARRIENNDRRVRDPDERWCHREEERASISSIYSLPPDPPGSEWAEIYDELQDLE